jgi:hypothetical protein
MREDVESRDTRRVSPTTSPMHGVEELVHAPSPRDHPVRSVDDHDARDRHFHWPETKRTRAVWADWEWRAWGLGQRARTAVRRAWQTLMTRDQTRDAAGDDVDHSMHATLVPVDDSRVTRVPPRLPPR